MADGRVKLEVDEVRVGDFFVKRERLHLKITDLNGVFSFRADARSAAGAWLNKMWERALMNDASAKSFPLKASRAGGGDAVRYAPA